MKIDRRKKAQYFRNMYGLNDVYAHKKDGLYDVGINGTSHHHVKLPHHKAELLVTVLVMQRG